MGHEFLAFVLAIAGQVVADLIGKWLDGWINDKKDE